MNKDNKWKIPYKSTILIVIVVVVLSCSIFLLIGGMPPTKLIVNVLWWVLMIYSIYKSVMRKQTGWEWVLIFNAIAGLRVPMFFSSILPIIYLVIYKNKKEIAKTSKTSPKEEDKKTRKGSNKYVGIIIGVIVILLIVIIWALFKILRIISTV